MIENFGGNIARLRKEQLLSQEDLADRIGLQKQTISNIERGIRYPTFETLEKLRKVLNAGPIELFGTEEEVALEETTKVLERIDENEDKIERMVRFSKAFNEQYIHEINEVYEKTEAIQRLFTKQPKLDEEGFPITTKDDEIIWKPSFFDTLPFDQLDEVINKIDYIKRNQELL